jgi:ArsR family transcriptional regulator, arsenate/arsenite/antimonite-responsive transcriptional repressor
VDSTVNILKALGDRNRLRIVLALSGVDELCACQITGLLEVTGATVSRHLAVLEQAGLVDRRRDGRWIWYRLRASAATARVLAWASEHAGDDPQIRVDRQLLAEILAVEPAAFCRLQRGDRSEHNERGTASDTGTTTCPPTEKKR